MSQIVKKSNKKSKNDIYLSIQFFFLFQHIMSEPNVYLEPCKTNTNTNINIFKQNTIFPMNESINQSIINIHPRDSFISQQTSLQ